MLDFFTLEVWTGDQHLGHTLSRSKYGLLYFVALATYFVKFSHSSRKVLEHNPPFYHTPPRSRLLQQEIITSAARIFSQNTPPFFPSAQRKCSHYVWLPLNNYWQITQTRGFDNSWCHAKTEFTNFFIIHFSHDSSSETEAKRSAILFLRRTLQGA